MTTLTILAALPLTGNALTVLAIIFGLMFGLLLHRGGVANYNVIVNQFRLLDFTVLKIMLTAIVVGGTGVSIMHAMGSANFHIKSADMLAVMLGAGLFGIGMVIYGYCPGTGIAAVASGSVHGLIGAFGMLAGGIAYGLSFPWISTHIIPRLSLGKVRLPDYTHTPEWLWLAGLAVVAVIVFVVLAKVIEPMRNRMA